MKIELKSGSKEGFYFYFQPKMSKTIRKVELHKNIKILTYLDELK